VINAQINVFIRVDLCFVLVRQPPKQLANPDLHMSPPSVNSPQLDGTGRFRFYFVVFLVSRDVSLLSAL
jgi:hypothetical protein